MAANNTYRSGVNIEMDVTPACWKVSKPGMIAAIAALMEAWPVAEVTARRDRLIVRALFPAGDVSGDALSRKRSELSAVAQEAFDIAVARTPSGVHLLIDAPEIARTFIDEAVLPWFERRGYDVGTPSGLNFVNLICAALGEARGAKVKP